MEIRAFLDRHYRHFNAATLVAAASAYREHLDQGGRMMVTLAGAMSTAELGLSLAEMIRGDKVHAITCTGANLEEDVFNLVAHDHYERVPNWRSLSADDETALAERRSVRHTNTTAEGTCSARCAYPWQRPGMQTSRSSKRPRSWWY